MQFIPMNRVQFLPQMEPVDIGDLAPYLTNLDVDDAVQSFGQLADRLLSQEDQSDCCAPTQPLNVANFEQLPLQHHHQPCLTSSSSSTSLSSSQASSPAPSDHYACLNTPASHSSPSSSSFSSSSSSFGSYSFSCWSGSSGPASVASSCDLPVDRAIGGGRRRSRAARKRGETSELRQRNASAAEKYRRRLKGREWTLTKEMEREQARNANLRRSLEAKLTLYREYVALLASNTCDQDAELAEIGSRTLSAIMGEVLNGHRQPELSFSGASLKGQHYHGDGHRCDHEVDGETELRNQLDRFQQILANNSSNKQQQQQQHQSWFPLESHSFIVRTNE